MMKEFENNPLLESLSKELKKSVVARGFHMISAYIKPSVSGDTSLLIVLPEVEFLDERIDVLYDYVAEIEHRYSSGDFNLSISIYGTLEGVDDVMIESDGYTTFL